MRGLPDEVLPQFEKQVIDAALVEAYSPANNAPGELLRQVEKIDDYGKVKEITFVGCPTPYGQRSFVHDFVSPVVRKVNSFFADGRVYDVPEAKWR
jgi:hypothetical protein